MYITLGAHIHMDNAPSLSPPPRRPSRKRDADDNDDIIELPPRSETPAILRRLTQSIPTTQYNMPVVQYNRRQMRTTQRSNRQSVREASNDTTNSEYEEGIISSDQYTSDGTPIIQIHLYNVTYTGAARLEDIYDEHKRKYIRYMVGQRIASPDNVVEPTWTCYVELRRSIRNSIVKNKIFAGTNAVVSPITTTREMSRAACLSDETRIPGEPHDVGPMQFGKWVTQGERKDISKCKEMIASGIPIETIRSIYTGAYSQCHRALNEMASDKARTAAKEDRIVTVCVYFGNEGSGKTYTAKQEARRISGDRHGYYVLTSGAVQSGGIGAWFDGYNGEKCLIIEEYDGWLDWPYFLKLLEGDFLPCQVKQQQAVYALWTHVWITSNLPIEHWTSIRTDPTETQRMALYRRIDVLIWMKSRDNHLTIKEHKDTPYNQKHYIEWKAEDDKKKKQSKVAALNIINVMVKN
jgi:hypothetical protein